MESLVYTGQHWTTSWEVEGTDTRVHLIFFFQDDGQLQSIYRPLIGAGTPEAENTVDASSMTIAERCEALSEELADAFDRDVERFREEINVIDYYEQINHSEPGMQDIVALLYRHDVEGMPNVLARYIWDTDSGRMNAVYFNYLEQ